MKKLANLELLNKEEYSSLILSIDTLHNDLLKRQNEKKIMIIRIVQNAIILILKTLDFATDTHY
jgi:hypothetical protein